MYETLKATEFLKALSEGRLAGDTIRVGIAKPDDNDANAILFSEPPTCKNWVKIPVSLIERVTVISNSYPCGDHEHPLVKLQLKRPPADNEFATVLAELLKHTATIRSQGQPGFPAPSPVTHFTNPEAVSRLIPTTPLRRPANGGDGGAGDGGGGVDLGSRLTGSFSFDTVGTQPFLATLLIEGCIVRASGGSGGAPHFSQSFPNNVITPGGVARIPFIMDNLQTGQWSVFASVVNVTGPVGPCNAVVPGVLYLGVDGGSTHCGVL